MSPTRTGTGLVLRLKMRPGQDAFDFTASTDRLRHGFAMQASTRARSNPVSKNCA